jgi:hypothetical protein
MKPNYKGTGAALLGGIDEIQAYLDDYIVKTQAIRSSPFCKPFEEEVHEWEACLLYIQVRLSTNRLPSFEHNQYYTTSGENHSTLNEKSFPMKFKPSHK